MSETVRVGVVGTSWWTDGMHLPSLKSHPRAEVVAICGRDRNRAEEMAKKYDIPRVFTNYQEMIEQGNLQALVVSTPDDTHYPITMNALEAGLHILCEKPLALKAKQAREMYEKAEAVGVKHMVFFTYRWLPPERYIRALIDQGYLGRCYHCNLHLLFGFGRGRQYGWRFDSQRANGMLADLGSHMIDLARWYVGDIAKVSANLVTFIQRAGVESQPLDPANDSAILALQFANGAQGTIYVSAVAVGDSLVQDHITLHGEAGTLEADLGFSGVEVRGARSDEDRLKPLLIPDSIWEGVDQSNSWEVFNKQSVGDRQFIDAILKDQPISPNFYDGWKVQEVIDAAIESHQSGSWVSLPQT